MEDLRQAISTDAPAVVRVFGGAREGRRWKRRQQRRATSPVCRFGAALFVCAGVAETALNLSPRQSVPVVITGPIDIRTSKI